MRSIWLKIINIGIDETTNDQEVMYIQVCNGLSVLISIWMLSLVPLILPYWPDSAVFAINGVVFPLLWPLILLINHNKKYMAARIYLTATSVAIITINVLSVGGQTENQLFITMYIASAFVVYPQTRHFLVVAAVGLIHFSLLEYWFSFNGPLVDADPAYYALIRYLSVFNIPVLFSIIALYHKDLLIKTQKRLRERTQAFRNLLDHAGQGFLTFDRRLVVQEEYSKECFRLFGKDIAGNKFVELLAPCDVQERLLLEDILHTVFEEDDLQREVCLTLLPSEAEVEGIPVKLQYKWIKEPSSASHMVMVVMTDISEKRDMEHHMEDERKAMRMVAKVVKLDRDFKELLSDYRSFAQTGIHALINNASSAMDKCSELSLLIHTYKGNFAQFDFVHLPRRLHDMETQFEIWKQRLSHTPSESEPSVSFAAWLGQLDLLNELADDMRILNGVLGDRFSVEDNRIMIESERLRRLEQRIMTLYPGPESESLVAEIRQLQYCPFEQLLGMYPAYAEQLARQTGKEIEPLAIKGGDFLVDPDVYAVFSRSLIHVFHNMIDHGIEMPDERIALGKDPRGRIGCRIIATDEGIELQLSNDGKPIDPSVIRSRVLEQGMCTAEQFDAMSAHEQRMLIVREGFSSKRTVTPLSGRGIGLSAVHKALRELKGTMRIDSDAEHGTTFTFILPRVQSLLS
ncbi:hypothetical protein FE783_16615 [Paenibacillus mesophilus]|uniref:ATP-binding protein n=1 Tax=Paenibacillus mesophilus TaxID=2582849 RepID=UPI00110D2F26|nr:ATP-binding protein [Paenibacillus mesophilus]TMV48677.1 hypothetical protein FE783_16615 [Paenibacillus mesophilus]